jgi:hypothetical protein
MSKLASGVAVTFPVVAVTIALLTAVGTPARAQVSVQGDPVKIQSVRPGERYSGIIVVRNSSADAQEAKVYQTDYAQLPDGSTTYADPGTVPHSNARWITVASRVVVPPGQSVDVPFTVTVPAADSLLGSYWSMVMVETVPRGTVESGLAATPPRPGTFTIATRFRYAVQIISNVGTGGRRDARFEAPGALSAKDSSKALRFDLRNTGTLAFAPSFTLELYADDGAHVKTLTAVREMTYPGMTLRQLFDLGRLKAGRYKAIVTADTGGDAVFGAQYAFTF